MTKESGPEPREREEDHTLSLCSGPDCCSWLIMLLPLNSLNIVHAGPAIQPRMETKGPSVRPSSFLTPIDWDDAPPSRLPQRFNPSSSKSCRHTTWHMMCIGYRRIILLVLNNHRMGPTTDGYALDIVIVHKHVRLYLCSVRGFYFCNSLVD